MMGCNENCFRSTRIASPFMPGTSAPTSSAKPVALPPFNVAISSAS